MSSPRKSSRLSGKKEGPAIDTFGEPWTEEELFLFFDGYKKHGINWKAFANTLPGRTLTMIDALFSYVKNYLSGKDATASGLVSILRDINNLTKKQILAPTQTNKTAKTPKNISPKSSASKNGSTSKRKMEDNNNNNATQQSTSVSPRSKRNAKGGLARQLFPTSPRPNKMPRMDVDSSKFEALTSLAANEAGDDQFLVPLKHREKMMRKVAPTIQLNSSQTYHEPVQLEFEYLQPAVQVTAIQNHFEQFIKQEKARKWSIYEWFYADVDKPFFAHNEFQECLDALGYSKVTTLTRSEWGDIRHKMGKVRRLSPSFFREEREKLNQQRQYIRTLRASKSPNRNGSIPREIPVPLRAGDSVMVHYNHSLYRGKIMNAVDDSSFTVQIVHHKLTTTNPDGTIEPDPITLVVPDTHIAHHTVSELSSVAKTPLRGKLSIQTPNPRQHPPLPHQQGLVSPGPPRAKFNVLDLKVLASFMAVEKNKERILEEITSMNTAAEQMAVSGKEYPMPFRVRYASLIKELDQVNQLLEKCLFYFCQRHPPAPGPQSWQQRTPSKPSTAVTGDLWAAEALEKLRHQSSDIVHGVFHDITLKEISANENNNSLGSNEAFLSNSEPLMEVTASMLTLLAYLNTCLESELNPTELSNAVDNALNLCKPKSDQNIQYFDELRAMVGGIKADIIKAKAG